MNIDNLKVKYLIGSFKEDPLWPTIEDFEYYISIWLNSPEGKEFNEHRNKSEKTQNILYFSEYLLSLRLGDDERTITRELLKKVEEEGLIQKISKISDVNQIYSIKKFKY